MSVFYPVKRLHGSRTQSFSLSPSSSIDPIYLYYLLGSFHCAQCCFSRVRGSALLSFPYGTCCRSAARWCGSGFHLMLIRILLFTLMRIGVRFFHLDADPDLHQSDTSLQPVANRPFTYSGWASTVLYKPPQLQAFLFDTDRTRRFSFRQTGVFFLM